MGYSYGKDLVYTFYPLLDDKSVILPSQTPSIYVFTDTNRPSLDDALNGTNALGSEITSWTQRGLGYDITIPAISDPDPTSNIDRRTFWIGINVVMQSGADVQTIIRSLEMQRVQMHHKAIEILYSDVISYFPQIEGYLNIQQIQRFITVSKAEIQNELKAKGFEWAQVYRPDQLTLGCIFKVMMYAMASQRKSPGDQFDLNFDLYKSSYQNFIQSLKLEYDSDRDGEPEEQPFTTDTIYLIR